MTAGRISQRAAKNWSDGILTLRTKNRFSNYCGRGKSQLRRAPRGDPRPRRAGTRVYVESRLPIDPS